MKTKATTIVLVVLALMTVAALISGIAAFAEGEEEHICIYRTISNTATCTEGGQKREVCSVCGDERTSDASALGHIMAERTIPATCETDGTYEEYCMRGGCTEKKTVVIPALGHNYEFDREEIFDCAVGRENVEICAVCSKEKRTPLGTGPEHELYAVPEVPATCLAVGYTAHEVCSLCSYTTTIEEIPALGHTYSDCACIRCGELLPVTDLTGTTWRIRADYSAPPMYGNIFLIPFTLNGNDYSTLGIGCAWNNDTGEWLAMDGAIGYEQTVDGYIEWEAFTITFTGSNGVKDNDLILWLLANGEQVEYVDISGTWVFGIGIKGNCPETNATFTCAANDIVYQGITTFDISDLKFLFGEQDTVAYEYGSWTDEGYRTITFDGIQTVEREFYDWLVRNAEQKTFAFTVEGSIFYAEPGMTWAEWLESDYNTHNFIAIHNGHVGDIVAFESDQKCLYLVGSSGNAGYQGLTDSIPADVAYIFKMGPMGGGSN